MLTGVVIPAFNEERMVAQVVAELCSLGYPVIVVDDGSSDATALVAASAGATVLSMPVHAGAWGATQTGMRHALRLGWRRVVTMDADGQHMPSTLEGLLQKSCKGELVIGSCPERASALRHVAWSFFRGLSGLPVKDITSGLRVYSRRAARLALSARGVMADYQDLSVLLILHRAGLTIHEHAVPMRTRHDGKSRIFSSWGRVTIYMLSTALVALSNRIFFSPKRVS